MTDNFPFIFVDESGVAINPGNRQPYFGVGLLKVEDPYLFTVSLLNTHFGNYSFIRSNRRQIISSLKVSPRALTTDELNLMLVSTRHYEYKFTDVTIDKVQRYKEFIKTAFEYGFQFSCVVVDKNDPEFKRIANDNYWDAYIYYTKKLCEYNCKENEKATIIADFNHKPNSSNKDFSQELTSLNCINNAIMLQSVGTPLIQLCDLFLGAAVFQHKLANNQTNDSNRTKAKEEFTEYLIELLEIETQSGQSPLSNGLTKEGRHGFSILKS